MKGREREKRTGQEGEEEAISESTDLWSLVKSISI